MSGEAEARHVGGRDDAVAERRRRGVLVERRHRPCGGLDGVGGGAARLQGRGDDPGPEGLRQDDDVPGARPRVGENPGRVHQARDRVAELDLGVANRVAPHQGAARFPELRQPPSEDRSAPLQGEVVLGKRRDGERRERPSPHGVDVGQGVRGGDGPEGLRVVHDRREEVDGLHQRRRRVQAEDAGVVSGRVVDEDAGVVVGGQAAQDLSELGGAELGRSTGAGDALGQPPDLLAFIGHCPRSPGLGQVYKIVFQSPRFRSGR